MTQYSIKDLEKLSGIKAHTIRIWEKRYSLLEPERTDTNIRFYSDEELRKILNVASLVKRGVKISKIAQMCTEALRNEIIKTDRQSNGVDLRIDQLVRLMIELNTSEFEVILNEIFSELGTEDAVVKVLFPFLEKIGLLWQIGSIMPVHEHFVSNLIRNKIIGDTEKLPPVTVGKTVLLFLKEDELHELSLLFYNFLARKNGSNTIYLGANVPLQDIAEISEKYVFDTVFTVFVNAISKESLNKYLNELTEIFRDKEILISGLQIRKNHPDIPSGITMVDKPEKFVLKLNAE